jgi:hypothetical protein
MRARQVSAGTWPITSIASLRPRVQLRSQHAVDHGGGELGHGRAGIEWTQPIGEEPLLPIALGAAEGSAGRDEYRGGIAVGTPSQQGLGDHAPQRVADQHRAEETLSGDERLDVLRQALKVRSSPFARSRRGPTRRCREGKER